MPPAFWRKVAISLAVGAVGAAATLTPPIMYVEEYAGLNWLFRLRGAVDPPPDVVVVSIDNDAASALALEPDPDRWPRSLHADLVRALDAAGAGVVVFDIMFEEPRNPDHDRELADAIRAAGNVILLERLSSDTIPLESSGSAIEIERRSRPIAELGNAALATAPFPLPTVPIKVSRFWVFGRSHETLPTLPAAALHAHALPVHDTFRELLETSPSAAGAKLARREDLTRSARLEDTGEAIRRLFRDNPALLDEMRSRLPAGSDEDPSLLIRALLELYGGPGYRYLSFYGPAGTIRTIPYDLVARGDAMPSDLDLDGKTVFVGFTEQQPSEQQDTFYTAFSDSSGSNLSGVEIGATAFANLLENRFVVPPGITVQLALVAIWGLLIASAMLWLPALPGLTCVALAGTAYVWIASWQFSESGIWLPMVTPLLGQIPVALVAAFAWKYSRATTETNRVRRALRAYVPAPVIEKYAQRVIEDRGSAQLLYGTCLVTDAENYTALSEKLQPNELHSVLNDYYGVLFPEVEQRGGFVADVVGDSMVAVWASPQPDPAGREQACAASIAILESVDRFNLCHPQMRLPTRIGIHSGQVLLGAVGTASHSEYRAVGDIVTTASRVQDLNKQLGTRLLVSEDALRGTAVSLYRPLGRFLLAGKGVPVVPCDLVTFSKPAPARDAALAGEFADALELFRGRRWREAAFAFDGILERFTLDGPSAFYRRLCDRLPHTALGEDWNGTISLPDHG